MTRESREDRPRSNTSNVGVTKESPEPPGCKVEVPEFLGR